MSQSKKLTADGAKSASQQEPLAEIRQLIPLLLRARELIMQHVRPVLGTFDLTEQQWRILRALVEGGTCDLGELGRRSQIVPPSLSRTVPSMERRGLVARASSGSNPHRILVSITPAGLGLYDGARATSDEALSKLLQGIDPVKIGKARLSLSELVASFSATPPDRGLEEMPEPGQ
ncbi:MarR family transcriptional regulator [Boseaceae bacterium BT-24-1]|nr:MarR family transcriptional regulator [Boseaceae bacterium BT-24-1]